MEYGITVLVEQFDPGPHYRRPTTIETAWGPAMKAQEVNKYFWTGDFYVEPHPPLPFLLRMLPSTHRTCPWIYLKIGGVALAQFEQDVNSSNDMGSQERNRDHPLLLLITDLLQDQRHWAVFFARQCDEFEGCYEQSLPELCRTIQQEYHWSNQDAHGFCAFSR